MYSDFPLLTQEDWLVVSEAHGTVTTEPDVVQTLRRMNRFVVNYERQRLSAEQFQSAYSTAIDDWAAVAAKYPVMVGHPATFAEKPLEFRDPTLAEIRNHKRWEQYLAGRRRFYAAANLLAAGVETGLLKSRVGRAISTGEKESLETSLRAVEQVQKVAIRQLAEGS